MVGCSHNVASQCYNVLFCLFTDIKPKDTQFNIIEDWKNKQIYSHLRSWDQRMWLNKRISNFFSLSAVQCVTLNPWKSSCSQQSSFSVAFIASERHLAISITTISWYFGERTIYRCIRTKINMLLNSLKKLQHLFTLQETEKVLVFKNGTSLTQWIMYILLNFMINMLLWCCRTRTHMELNRDTKIVPLPFILLPVVETMWPNFLYSSTFQYSIATLQGFNMWPHQA